MTKPTSLEAFLQSGEYLPEPLRDFHDQKGVFRSMHEMVREDPSSFVRRPDWVEGQCYVIDVFLWFMARRGWTLQRSRKHIEFRDLEADVRAHTEKRQAQDAALLMSAMSASPKTKGETP